MNEETGEISWGLEGISVTTTKLSSVTRLEEKLTTSGYGLEDLAPQASFEVCSYLLLHDRLPNPQELADLISP